MFQGAAYPTAGRANYALSLLMVATFTALLDRYLIGLVLDAIRADLRITDLQVSLLQGLAFAVFYSVIGLPFGRLIDHSNRRNIIIAAVLTWSVMTVCCGLARNYAELFAARLGVGLGEACLAPAAHSLITDLFAPRRHGRALAGFTLASIIGGGGSFIVGAAALGLAKSLCGHGGPFGHLAPWRTTFILIGSPGLLVALLLMTVGEPIRHGRSAAQARTSYIDVLGPVDEVPDPQAS